MFFIGLILFLFFGSCDSNNKIHIDNAKYLIQTIDERDSSLILHTVEQWGIKRFDRWSVRTDMYKYTFNNVNYFIGAIFYNKDKSKMIVWVGTKEPNAHTVRKYSEDSIKNRICPTGGDTIYHMGALIGFRENTNTIWSLYSLDNRFVPCGDNKKQVIDEMSKYYFKDMKESCEKVLRSTLNSNYGGKVRYDLEQKTTELGYNLDTTYIFKNYGYNLQDEGFWERSLLWQKGARVHGYYNFQLLGQDTIELPKINYPSLILNSYSDY